MSKKAKKAAAPAAIVNSERTATKEAPAMMRVPGSSILVSQPRALMIPKPAWFYLEPRPEQRTRNVEVEGSGKNLIEIGDHQFDPNRPVSYAPMMPHIPNMRDTGNPYCANAEAADKLLGADWTSKSWRDFVKLSHAVFSMLSERTEGFTSTQVIETAVKITGVGLNKKGEIGEKAIKCVMDTLRDLRLFGLATFTGPINEAKKTHFKLAEDWAGVELLKEVKAGTIAA